MSSLINVYHFACYYVSMPNDSLSCRCCSCCCCYLKKLIDDSLSLSFCLQLSLLFLERALVDRLFPGQRANTIQNWQLATRVSLSTSNKNLNQFLSLLLLSLLLASFRYDYTYRCRAIILRAATLLCHSIC